MDEQEDGGFPNILLLALIPLFACGIAFLAGVILLALALV
jgi:hypothetical protein